MVFKLCERTFAANELGQLAYEYQNQLEDGLPYDFSLLMPKKLTTLDGREEILDRSHMDNATAGALNMGSLNGLGGSINKSHGVEKLNGVFLIEHHKRSLADDEDGLFTSKRPKQLEPNLPLDAHLHSGNLQGSPSGENDSHVHPPFLMNSFPSCSGHNLLVCDKHQPREVYSSFLDYYPRKLVAIGPNHQAIIPEWRSDDLKKHFRNKVDCDSALITAGSSSLADKIAVGEDSGKMIGTCVTPMPKAATLFSQIGILHSNTKCSCSDVGSVRCIRQHITEVRMNLHNELGHHTFAELGLYDMGECVSENWTEGEEHLFREVVLANPASLGKNFWNVLPHVLPSRDSKELVSYYFNVFILRKRAGQNRLDPMNADSDDDEWKECDDDEYTMEGDNDGWKEGSDSEYATEEENEDSAVESPEEQGATYAEAFDEEDDVDESDGSEEYAVVKDDEGRISAFSNTCTGNSSQDYVEEVADDSCTSFEAHYNRVDFSSSPLENVETQPLIIEQHENLLRNDDLGTIADHGFFEGLFGFKTWDMSYSHGGQEEDFFSTLNVIEEVFGDESQKSNADSS